MLVLRPLWFVIVKDVAPDLPLLSQMFFFVSVACTAVVPRHFRCFEFGSRQCYGDWD